MIIVNGTVRFGAGEIDRLKEAMARNVEATRAEEGCEHYAYAVDITDPNLLHVSERWRDDAAIERHMTTPHMGEFMALVGASKVEGMSIKAYEARFLRNVLGE
ncbi:MAG TPA: putative quinol monooxygenase [Allosphingosinicella sp.]|nr:putative quinol monooxygenase [Allosphingosinicella sp.]